MSGVLELKAPELPVPVARRGISEHEWRTLVNLYPGAQSESILLVFDYCRARKLDPMKKPCHIVPMSVKDAKSGQYIWRDVVMPGIYEYRTTATRTGQYMGHSEPQYGELTEYVGTTAPLWCSLTVYRWNAAAGQRSEYPVRVYFAEVVALEKSGDANARWRKAPIQMLTKCTEAAALREAFPDEFGGEVTAEEMEGQIHEAPPLKADLGPRGDMASVDWEARDKWFSTIVDLLNQDKDENGIAEDLRTAADELNRSPELYTALLDKLAAEKIISKGNWRKYLTIGTGRG